MKEEKIKENVISNNGLRVYKYSACITISSRDISILCDPWFSDNAYYGTWEEQPKHDITREYIGNFDAIWISHIHPDHYCPSTIKKLVEIYGEKPIYISDWGDNKNYLKLKLEADGWSSIKYIRFHKVRNYAFEMHT